MIIARFRKKSSVFLLFSQFFWSLLSCKKLRCEKHRLSECRMQNERTGTRTDGRVPSLQAGADGERRAANDRPYGL